MTTIPRGITLSAALALLASVWWAPAPTTLDKSLVTKIQQGKATAALLSAGGATQLGIGLLLPDVAREVEFGFGFVRTEAKSTPLHVRAVRGGL